MNGLSKLSLQRGKSNTLLPVISTCYRSLPAVKKSLQKPNFDVSSLKYLTYAHRPHFRKSDYFVPIYSSHALKSQNT